MKRTKHPSAGEKRPVPSVLHADGGSRTSAVRAGLHFVISIIEPDSLELLLAVQEELSLPLSLTFLGQGTATKSMLSLLGMERNEKRVVVTVADSEKTAALIQEQRRRLYIDAPGNGMVVTVPVKSVGGGKTLAYLGGDAAKMGRPDIKYPFELILAIANEGCTDLVMDAARPAGAMGGTVLHGKGTGAKNAENFFHLSLASEKEMILIVAHAEKKAAIMQAILRNAGPGTPAGTIVFSLPVTNVAGFSLAGFDSPEQPEREAGEGSEPEKFPKIP